ncbi:MAG: hypothetical protein MN733_31200 [Nitrososphaera sp.]|nr:hypothetical protein [Nitrososphaera sp.]
MQEDGNHNRIRSMGGIGICFDSVCPGSRVKVQRTEHKGSKVCRDRTGETRDGGVDSLTMYNGAVDAFEEVMSGREDGSLGSVCRIKRISKDNTRLENGIEYCFVEIACGNGIQYGIEAFGEEALEIRRRASKISSYRTLSHVIPLIEA